MGWSCLVFFNRVQAFRSVSLLIDPNWPLQLLMAASALLFTRPSRRKRAASGRWCWCSSLEDVLMAQGPNCCFNLVPCSELRPAAKFQLGQPANYILGTGMIGQRGGNGGMDGCVRGCLKISGEEKKNEDVGNSDRRLRWSEERRPGGQEFNNPAVVGKGRTPAFPGVEQGSDKLASLVAGATLNTERRRSKSLNAEKLHCT